MMAYWSSSDDDFYDDDLHYDCDSHFVDLKENKVGRKAHRLSGELLHDQNAETIRAKSLRTDTDMRNCNISSLNISICNQKRLIVLQNLRWDL